MEESKTYDIHTSIREVFRVCPTEGLQFLREELNAGRVCRKHWRWRGTGCLINCATLGKVHSMERCRRMFGETGESGYVWFNVFYGGSDMGNMVSVVIHGWDWQGYSSLDALSAIDDVLAERQSDVTTPARDVASPQPASVTPCLTAS